MPRPSPASSATPVKRTHSHGADAGPGACTHCGRSRFSGPALPLSTSPISSRKEIPHVHRRHFIPGHRRPELELPILGDPAPGPSHPAGWDHFQQAAAADGGPPAAAQRLSGSHPALPPLRPVCPALAGAHSGGAGLCGRGDDLHHRSAQRCRPGRLPGPSEHPVQSSGRDHPAGLQALHRGGLCGDRLRIRHSIPGGTGLYHAGHRGKQGDLHPQQPALLRHHYQLHPAGPPADGDHDLRLL